MSLNGDRIAESQSAQETKKRERLAYGINFFVAGVSILGVLFSMIIYFYDKKSKDVRIVVLDSAAFFQNKSDLGQAIPLMLEQKK